MQLSNSRQTKLEQDRDMSSSKDSKLTPNSSFPLSKPATQSPLRQTVPNQETEQEKEVQRKLKEGAIAKTIVPLSSPTATLHNAIYHGDSKARELSTAWHYMRDDPKILFSVSFPDWVWPVLAGEMEFARAELVAMKTRKNKPEVSAAGEPPKRRKSILQRMGSTREERVWEREGERRKREWTLTEKEWRAIDARVYACYERALQELGFIMKKEGMIGWETEKWRELQMLFRGRKGSMMSGENEERK